MAPKLLDLWEISARSNSPERGLTAMVEALSRQLHRATVQVGLAGRDVPNLRWLATAGARVPGSGGLAYVSASEAARLHAHLARHRVTRVPAGEAPRALTSVLGEGLASDAVVAALELEGDAPGVLLVTLPARATASALRLIEASRAPLAVALGHLLRGGPATAEPPSGASAAEADRDGLSDRIIGADGGLRAVMVRVGQVSRSDVPVLILGETGSGKEVIARAIHAHSARSGAAFIRVNCGAIPPELIDSELFGHERGAFTGAAGRRRGWFEQADGGTLFLDEIGELPLAAQVRLLRILQEGRFQRVGGEQTVSVDVRVVAATHRDLSAMIADGRFREDLWYRLEVFPIRLPPLREHRGDIPAMAEHFARRAAARFGVAVRFPDPEDLRRLMAYDWPGNVRELGAVIDRAVLLGDGERLEIAKALGEAPVREPREPIPVAAAAQATLASSSAGSAPTDPRDPVAAAPGGFATLDEAMRRHIEAALVRCGGRIEGRHGAARLLDVNPHTLRGKMRRLGVAWKAFRGDGGAVRWPVV